MTTPDSQSPAEERPEPARASTGPTVTTAPPPRAGRRWSRLPSHVGPARMSTVVLAALFAGIFVLYLFVRPETPATAGSTGTSSGTVQQTQQPTPTHSPTPTHTPPTTTATSPTHTSPTAPTETTTGTPTTTSPPTGTARYPGQTSGNSAPLPSLPTTGSAPSS